MYFRPQTTESSPWSPPAGFSLNPWMTPVGAASDNNNARAAAAAYWSDFPFPREGSTYQSLLDELVAQLFQDLYEIIDKEETAPPPDDPPRAPAPPPDDVDKSALPTRSKVTGVFEMPQLPPHAAPAPGGVSFPSEAMNRTCGKLALLYPLKSRWINEAVNKKLDPADWRSVKTCSILRNWLKEMYNDDCGTEADGAEQTAAAAAAAGRSCFCNFCQKALKPYNFRVRCAECPDYDLCERCFAEGRETEGHLKTHRYIPIGTQNRSLFKEQWSASEELILLEAVGKYGFGNWNEVSEWVSIVSPGNTVPKDKDACRKQYFDFHLMNRKTHSVITWPIQNVKSKLLYDGSLGFTQALVQHCEEPTAASGATTGARESEVDYSPVYDARGIDILVTDCRVRPVSELPWPAECTDPEEWEQPEPNALVYHQACKPAGALPPRVSIVGYLPNRGESDNEWENSYELSICDLEIKEYETPMEKELKLRALEAYNTLLDQRALRKRLYLDKYILNSPATTSVGGSISGAASGGPVADFKTKWLAKNNSDIYAAFRQLWKHIYTNRSEFPAALFTKTQKHHECLSDVLPVDLEEIPELIADDANLVDRLDLLSAWREADLATLEDVVEKGGAISQRIDQRDPVFWGLKFHTREPSAGDTGGLTTSEKLRLTIGLSPAAFAQLQAVVKAEVRQVSCGTEYKQVALDSPTQLVDVLIDAAHGELESPVRLGAAVAAAVPEPLPPPEPAAAPESLPVSQSASSPPSAGPVAHSANAVLSFAQRQVVQEASVTPARTIPKKRRMLNVEEEGEIPGG